MGPKNGTRMGPRAHHQVNRLATIAFHSVVKESYRRSGAFDAMVDYIHITVNSLRVSYDILLRNYSSSKLKDLHRANDVLLKRILKMDLPRHLVIELGNCMIEYQKSILQFANFITSNLDYNKIVSRDNVQTLCECIAVRPDGILDKQRSILNAVGSTNLIGFSPGFMASFFCVSPAKAIQEYEKRAAEGKYYPDLSKYAELSNPLEIWKARQTRQLMDGLFYECVAIHGHWEALEYFFYEMDPSIRRIELSKAACCIEHHDISADKILFFRKHMDPSAWRTVLKRCFFKIFNIFVKNFRYKYMCAILYSEVREELDAKVIFSCINALNGHILGYFWSPTKMELMLADLEPVFISLWQLIPIADRKNIGNTIFQIYQTLLRYSKHNAVITLIKDEEAFTANRRNQLTGCAVMAMILNNEHNKIFDFLKRISPETYDVDRVKDELFTPDNLSIFIAFVDRCYHITNYDRLLEFKYSTVFSIEVAKKCLLFNGNVNYVILQALRQGYICASQYEAFLFWVFNHNNHNNQRAQVDQYVKSCQQPPNLLVEIYKFYMTSSRRSMYTIPAFQQSDEVTQKIRRLIATDQETLYAYCHMLMLNKDYAALPKMLTSVFSHEREREQFLTGFFLSRHGLESIYCMLMSPVYHNNYFCRFILKKKLKDFLDFKNHWILTPRINAVLELVLNGYGQAQVAREESNADELMEEIKLDILPHESVDEFSLVYNVNIAIFKCILRNSFVVEMFHALANAC